MMIKRQVLPILILIVTNLTLAAALAWLWLTPKGQLRDVHWQEPAAKEADFASGLPSKPQVAPYENARLIALLDRPLFALARRPPPPPPPPPVPPPVDVLSTARLSAIYSGAGGGGVVLNLGGKSRKLRLNENLDGWTLQTIDARSATFAASGQTRVLQLGRAALTASPGAVPLSATVAPANAQEAAPPPRRPASSARAVFGGT